MPRPATPATTAAPPAAARRPTPMRRAGPRSRPSRSSSRAGRARPWKTFHVSTRSAIRAPYTCALATAPAHRRGACARGAACADRARARAQGGAARLTRARGQARRADLPEAVHAHARVVRAGIVELGGHPLVLRPDEMQLSARRGAARHRARALPSRARDRDPHGLRRPRARARRACARPGCEHAHRRSPPLPGTCRLADLARDLRNDSTG